MKLIISIPALNEEKTISGVIKRIPRNIGGISSMSVIVIDDGSSDRTAAYAKESGATVVSLETHRGLGVAFQEAVNQALMAGADILVSIDGDGQFAPEDIPQLIEPILIGKADVVTASRFKDRRLIPCMPGIKKWGNRQVSILVSYLSHTTIHDVSCGFRAYSREALLHLNLFGKFTYTHESLMNLLFKDFRILEVPIEVKGQREYGESRVAGNLWIYTYNILNTIFRTMLDYKPLRIFGWLGVSVFFFGLILDIILGLYYLSAGYMTPFKTLGFVGGFLNIVGLVIVIVGLISDMLNRIRMTQERSLYYTKKEYYQSRPYGKKRQ